MGQAGYHSSMCGRYTLVNLAALTDLFPWIGGPPTDVPPRYNIAPSQPILAVDNEHPDQWDFFLWGLIPAWAKDPTIGNKLCNARAETLAEKNTFKNAYRRRRCAIPADGFYEWRLSADGKTKQPVYIRRKGHKPFALAGLWETWQNPSGGGEELQTATIITTRPNELMTDIHARMPVMLDERTLKRWLEPGEKKPGELDDLLAPYPASDMEAYPVSKQVNTPRNDGPDLIKEIQPEKTTLFG